VGGGGGGRHSYNLKTDHEEVEIQSIYLWSVRKYPVVVWAEAAWAGAPFREPIFGVRAE
jgi:hypothetical protein